jgi:hypothetical protein
MPRSTIAAPYRVSGLKHRSTARLAAVLIAFLLSPAANATVVPLVGDTFVSSNRPMTTFGTLSNLYVGNGNTALMQFDLSALSTFPGGITQGQVAKATLTIFVNRVNAAGTVNLLTVTSPWIESGVEYATAPTTTPTLTLTTPKAAITFGAATAGQYIAIDVTGRTLPTPSP